MLSTLNCTPKTPTLSVALAEMVTVPESIAPEARDVIESVGKAMGVIRKARCPFALFPIPAICPASLIAEPRSEDQPELSGVEAAKKRTAPSRNVYSWSQTAPSQYVQPLPRMWPDPFMAIAVLKPMGSTPKLMSLAWLSEIKIESPQTSIPPFEAQATPTTSALSLIA